MIPPPPFYEEHQESTGPICRVPASSHSCPDEDDDWCVQRAALYHRGQEKGWGRGEVIFTLPGQETSLLQPRFEASEVLYLCFLGLAVLAPHYLRDLAQTLV